jgi:uncharacterized membrane protein (DUF373 family)
MESLDEMTKGNKTGFFKHVFNFNEESKSEMMNIVQYGILALLPVVFINKLMNKYVPEADDEKKSIEILAEIIIQVVVLFLGILLIHRIITYVPTYSGEKYADFSVTNIILAMLVIILSLQTKLGEKVSILVDRVTELWEGPKDMKNQKGRGNVRVSQPISQGQMAMNQALMSSPGTTSLSALPPPEMVTQQQQLPDYNAMHQNNPTPLVGAATPGVESFGPAAANEGMGGAFGSAFGGW